LGGVQEFGRGRPRGPGRPAIVSGEGGHIAYPRNGERQFFVSQGEPQKTRKKAGKDAPPRKTRIPAKKTKGRGGAMLDV